MGRGMKRCTECRRMREKARFPTSVITGKPHGTCDSCLSRVSRLRPFEQAFLTKSPHYIRIKSHYD